MDRTLVYSKTPAGEEATRQRTRVVQRNLRMVLLQVDGQLNVDGLVAKIGNEALVLGALRELEKEGYIALSLDAPSVWEQGKQKVRQIGSVASAQLSQLSSFGPSKAEPLDNDSFEPSIIGEANLAEGKSGQIKKAVSAAIAEPAVVVPEKEEPFIGASELSSVQPKSAGTPAAERRQGIGEYLGAWLAARGAGRASVDQVRPGKIRDSARYQPQSWSRLLLAFCFFFLLAGVSLLFLYPYDRHRAVIEMSMQQMTGMPVRIGAVNVEIYPKPSLILSEIRLGKANEVHIRSLHVPGLFSLFGSGPKRIPEVVVKEMEIQADALTTIPILLSGVRANKMFLLERLRFEGMRLGFAGASLEGLEGEAVFRTGEGEGDWVLATPGRGLQLHFKPSGEGVDVNILSRGWKPSENSPYQFSLIYGKGTLQRGKLSFDRIEFGLANGIFRGRWGVDWKGNRLTMAAKGDLTDFETRKLLEILSIPMELSGRLSGQLVLSGTGSNWVSLWSGAEAALVFEVENGLFSGADLGEAMRRGIGNPVRGGQTKFDRMRGQIVVGQNKVSGRNFILESGLSRAGGHFMAKNDYVVEAVLQMDILGSSVPVRAPLRVSGTLPVLQTVVLP